MVSGKKEIFVRWKFERNFFIRRIKLYDYVISFFVFYEGIGNEENESFRNWNNQVKYARGIQLSK